MVAKQTAETEPTIKLRLRRRHFQKNLPIEKESPTTPTTMLHVVETLVLGILVSARAETTSVYCPGNRQYVDIPNLYDKEVPEYAHEEIGYVDKMVTDVYLFFEICQLKSVQEDR